MGLVLADTLAGAILPEPYAAELAALNAANDGLSQAQRVLGPRVLSEDPERTFLYLQIAGFNSVTRKTLKGQMPRYAVADLARLATPILFVVGEDDVLCPPRFMKAAHELVPGSRFEVIRGAGHSAYFEDPKAFNALVLGFLDAIVATR